MALFNLARMTVSSTGTGTITLNAAVSGFLTFDAAGCSTASAGQSITYAIGDTTQSEIATGTYRSSSLTLTRGSSTGGMKSTNSNSPINMSNAAQVIITPAAKDFPWVTDNVGSTATSSAAVTISGATGSTSTTTGALVVTGGIGVGGATFADKFSATNQPCFSAHKNAVNQSGIANATFTKLTFGTELFDIGSFYDTGLSRWTPPAGMVHIMAATFLQNTMSAGTEQNLTVYKNGARFKDGRTVSPGGSNGVSVSIIDRANGTDFYEIFVWGVAATTFESDGAISTTYFMGSAI